MNILNNCSYRFFLTKHHVFSNAINEFPLENPKQEISLSENPKKELCSVVPTLHGADTQEWRKRLIQIAKHNIVISGNYCGGKAFDEIIKAIAKRMQEVPTLKVVIIAHPKSVKDHPDQKYENKKLITDLQKLYPSRFSYVESPDSYFGMKKITNHTKCTVIDYGKYFIQGSSGIKDAFNATGVESKSNEMELLEAKKMQKGGSLIDRIIAVHLREEDFVFSPADDNLETGKKMYRQALYLAYKWQQHKENVGWFGHYLSPESWDLDDKEAKEFPAFSTVSENSSMARKEFKHAFFLNHKERDAALPFSKDSSIDIECDQESALYQMLQETIPAASSITTKESSFEKSERKVDNVIVKLFFTGPENKVSRFEKQMIKRIDHATNHIVIAHMYFQPTCNIMKALIAAAKRGVKITIITAGLTKNSPPGEKFFAPRNVYNYSYLIKRLPEKVKGNVSVYQFDQKDRGLHKKVVIVDDYIFSGSSNMGYKSLVLMGDHEMNFEAHSSDLVQQTMHVINKDIRCSAQVLNPENVTLGEMWQASVHSLGARFWG